MRFQVQVRREQLGALLEQRRHRLRRVNVRNLNIELADVQLERDVAEPNFVTAEDGPLGFSTRLNLHGRGGYMQICLDDLGLRELADAINTYLERPQPPIELKVLLEQPKKKARKRRAPAAAPEQLDEVAAIKKKMMEGR